MPDLSSRQLVVFSLGSEEYALPVGAVHEIIRFTEVLTVSSAQREAVPVSGDGSVEAIARIGDRLVLLLDPEGVLAGMPAAA